MSSGSQADRSSRPMNTAIEDSPNIAVRILTTERYADELLGMLERIEENMVGLYPSTATASQKDREGDTISDRVTRTNAIIERCLSFAGRVLSQVQQK